MNTPSIMEAFRTTHSCLPIAAASLEANNRRIHDWLSNVTDLPTYKISRIDHPDNSLRSYPSLNFALTNPGSSGKAKLERSLAGGSLPWIKTEVSIGSIYSVKTASILLNILLCNKPIPYQYLLHGIYGITDLILKYRDLKILPEGGVILDLDGDSFPAKVNWEHLENIAFGSRLGLEGVTTPKNRFQLITQSQYFNPLIFAADVQIPIDDFSAYLGHTYDDFRAYVQANEATSTKYEFDPNETNPTWMAFLNSGSSEMRIYNVLKGNIQTKKFIESKYLSERICSELSVTPVEIQVLAEKLKKEFRTEILFNKFLLSSMPSTIVGRLKAIQLEPPIVVIEPLPKLPEPKIEVEAPTLSGIFNQVKAGVKTSKTKVAKAPGTKDITTPKRVRKAKVPAASIPEVIASTLPPEYSARNIAPSTSY